MSLIAMCIHCTETSGRLEYAKICLESLTNTVDLTKHRLFLIDNASYEEATAFLLDFIEKHPATLMRNTENLGTARGINRALKERLPGEYCIKMDEDIVVNQSGWVEYMESVIERDTTIGITGLKRRDINFDPNNSDQSYRSTLVGLPHIAGQTWINVERGPSIMGSCTMYNHLLLDKINALKQPGLYGFDDALVSLRSELAGFWNCYLPHIDIDHIDRGDNPQTQVKWGMAGAVWNEHHKWHEEYISGTRPLWEDFE